MDEQVEPTVDETTWDQARWEEFHAWAIKGYLGWYNLHANRYERRAASAEWIAIGLGVAATVAAAFPSKDLGWSDNEQALVKWLVVLLTACATSAAAIFAKLADLARKRERGRAAMAAIEQEARIKLTMEPMGDRARSHYLLDLSRRITDIEGKYGTEFAERSKA
ncbi:hypothetical protein [Jiella sonneratiae]|uniref:SLATT domain-containing protein n=1 Tax=Jiella sonneratiae TaxID=2816856 RepID=A0ABS3JAH8_9HYPH|nr:hypothetical protein [Jiella sonneratiae]MBO0905576.1 hypothetical protein [Jiella sonneratiae]